MSQRPGAAQGAKQQWEGEFFCFFSRARLRVSPRRAGWARPNLCYVLGWWRAAAPRGPAPPSARSGARISGKANINLRKTLPLAGRRPCRFRASAALSTDLTGLRAANRRIQRRRARSRAVSRPKPGAAHRCPTRSLGVRRFLAARLLRRLGVTRRTRLLFRIWQPAHPAGALRLALPPAECEPYTHLQQMHTACLTLRTQCATS